MKNNKLKSLIFVISGPSGSGKTSLLKEVLLDKVLRKNLAKSVSVTTRPKRSVERKGRDYFFVSEAHFRRLRKAKKILEWTRYLGYYYGTQKEFVEGKLNSGVSLALCLDLRGALKLKKLYPNNVVTVFVLPPSIKELRKRIFGRCANTKREEVKRRLALAKRELVNAGKYDYVLKNNNFKAAANKLKGIILKEIGLLRK